MFMQRFLSNHGYCAPAGDDGAAGGGGGGAADRGDDFKPSPLEGAGKDGKAADPKEGEGEADPAKKEGEEDPDAETEEEKAEREAAEAAEEKKRRARIPKSRFDEAIGKAKQREAALLEEIDRLKGSKTAEAKTNAVGEFRAKIDELQDKYEDLILDGKKEEARKVRKQVEAMRDELVEYQTNVKSDAARKSAVEELTFDAKLASFEAKYPAMNPEHPDFDEDKTNEMADLVNTFVKAGQKRADALAKAVRYVLGNPPADTGKGGDAETDAAKLRADRAEAARRKAADANGRQPANTARAGIDSDKGGKGGTLNVDVMKMKPKEFEKLDEETKAKLRGDVV
jgi:hypothetical protein